MAVLQGRCREQNTQIDAAKALEYVLREAQAILELRITQIDWQGPPGRRCHTAGARMTPLKTPASHQTPDAAELRRRAETLLDTSSPDR